MKNITLSPIKKLSKKFRNKFLREHLKSPEKDRKNVQNNIGYLNPEIREVNMATQFFL